MRLKRPMPPKDINAFAPAPEVWEWLRETILNPDHKLFNPDHKHLLPQRWPNIVFMWADGGYSKGGKSVIGTAEKVMIQGSGWKRERQEHQMQEWFRVIPDFIITLDARFCNRCADVEFCALVEHELYHIGHAKDEFGMPAYNRYTGKPKLAIVLHDVEEFVGVVRRYGASQDDIQKLVDAALSKPEVSQAAIRAGCGSCLMKIA